MRKLKRQQATLMEKGTMTNIALFIITWIILCILIYLTIIGLCIILEAIFDWLNNFLW